MMQRLDGQHTRPGTRFQPHRASDRNSGRIPTQHSKGLANCSGGDFLEKQLTLNQQNPLQQRTKVRAFWIIVAFHLYCLTAAGSAKTPS